MAKVTFKSSPIHTSGELPKVGTKAPDFALVDAELKEHSLKDFRGKRKIISIVPSLDTSVCSLSAKKFNEAMKKHSEALVIVVSADSPFAQKRVCVLEDLKNILTLSLIRSKDFAKSYGVLIEDGPLMGLCARAIVVLDEENRVLYTELVPEITHEPNYEKALDALLQGT
jgi:thiol peroxidase